MAMSDPGRDYKRRQNLRKAKVLGFVVANDDSKHPDGKKLQRLQIRVPMFDRNTEDADLPWVVQQMGTGGSGNGGDGMGVVNVPAVNSKVWVHFEDDDDPHNRFYTAYAPTEDVMKDNEVADMDYPHTYGGVDQMGRLQFTNTTENTMNTTHISGQVDATDGSGERTMYSPKRIVLVSDGDIVLKAAKGIKIHADGVTSLKGGSKVKINGSDAKVNGTTIDKRRRPKTPSQAGKNTR